MKLSAENLSFGYHGHVVGHDVSLAMEGGEVLCVLGPNGGGKTTLFRTLLGLLPPLGGNVKLDGVDVAGRSREDMARMTGYVPQAHAGQFPFTVREVVLMGRTAHLGLFSTPTARDREIANAALATLGIPQLAERVYTRISGGERQLALIARALAQESRLLIMDEPTANLDFGNQVRVLDRIRALAAQGIGILFSTHDPDHAFLCADRVALLHDGRIDRLGTPRDMITADSLRLLYGVEVRIAEIGPEQRPICVPSLANLN